MNLFIPLGKTQNMPTVIRFSISRQYHSTWSK